MKHFYYVVSVDYTGDKHYYKPGEDLNNQKFYSFVESATECDNLLSRFNMWGRVLTVNAFETKKRADEIAAFWNDCYRKNGTFALA